MNRGLPAHKAIFEGERLKRLASNKRIKSSLGERLEIGVFFSGAVKNSAGKMVRDREANCNVPDIYMLRKADVIVSISTSYPYHCHLHIIPISIPYPYPYHIDFYIHIISISISCPLPYHVHNHFHIHIHIIFISI